MVGASGRATACAASVAAVEPTPIFAALAAPAHDDGHRDGRTVAQLLRALRAEREAPTPAQVGHVPDLLSFPTGTRD
jgi:hypothetical protein